MFTIIILKQTYEVITITVIPSLQMMKLKHRRFGHNLFSDKKAVKLQSLHSSAVGYSAIHGILLRLHNLTFQKPLFRGTDHENKAIK